MGTGGVSVIERLLAWHAPAWGLIPTTSKGARRGKGGNSWATVPLLGSGFRMDGYHSLQLECLPSAFIRSFLKWE